MLSIPFYAPPLVFVLLGISAVTLGYTGVLPELFPSVCSCLFFVFCLGDKHWILLVYHFTDITGFYFLGKFIGVELLDHKVGLCVVLFKNNQTKTRQIFF